MTQEIAHWTVETAPAEYANLTPETLAVALDAANASFASNGEEATAIDAGTTAAKAFAKTQTADNAATEEPIPGSSDHWTLATPPVEYSNFTPEALTIALDAANASFVQQADETIAVNAGLQAALAWEDQDGHTLYQPVTPEPVTEGRVQGLWAMDRAPIEYAAYSDAALAEAVSAADDSFALGNTEDVAVATGATAAEAWAEKEAKPLNDPRWVGRLTEPVVTPGTEWSLEQMPDEFSILGIRDAQKIAIRVGNNARLQGDAEAVAIGKGVEAAHEWLHRGGDPGNYV